MHAPLSLRAACHLVTGGDDYQTLIWDLSGVPKPVDDPILAYTADGEINNLVWCGSMSEWITIAFDFKIRMLRYELQHSPRLGLLGLFFFSWAH